jgi:hypothetical protein
MSHGKGRGTFLLQIGPIRNHRQFDVKLSAIEGAAVLVVTSEIFRLIGRILPDFSIQLNKYLN